MSSVPNFLPPSGGGGSDYPQFNIPTGSNQWMSYPTMPMPGGSPNGLPGPGAFGGAGTYGAMASPGIVPPSGGYNLPSSLVGYPQIGRQPSNQTLPYLPGPLQNVGELQKVGGGMKSAPTIDPALTQALAGYLQSQVGQGVTPFDLSAIMPSTGQTTAPGTLTAPLTDLMSQLQSFYQGQGPGVTGYSDPNAPGQPSSGSPLNYILPMWQSEMSAMNLPIQQQYANLKEQFGSMGLTGSSAAANALSQYGAQTAAEQQAMLGNLTMQALPIEQQMAGGLQSYDQTAIQNMLQEFIRTQPQSNPLLNMQYGLGTTFPPLIQGKGGILSGLLGSLPSMIPGLASGAGAGLAAAGAGSGVGGAILAGLAGI